MKLHSCGIWHLFTLKMELTCAGKRSHQDSIRPRWDHSRCQVGSHFLHFTSEQSDPLNLQCLWESWLKNNTRNCSGQIRDKRTREARFRDDVGSISKHVYFTSCEKLNRVICSDVSLCGFFHNHSLGIWSCWYLRSYVMSFGTKKLWSFYVVWGLRIIVHFILKFVKLHSGTNACRTVITSGGTSRNSTRFFLFLFISFLFICILYQKDWRTQ